VKPLGTAALCLALLGATGAARAESESPAAAATEYSALERRLIERALASRGFVLERHPEGKVLEGVEYEILEVFDDDDPLPDELNVLHTRTKEWVLAREVLLQVGAPWNQSLADETARNIRSLIQISHALAVPIEGSSAGKVKLLLVVRDIWSLRPDWDVQFMGGKVNYFLFLPTDSNAGGIHHEPQLLMLYEPLSLQTGGSYAVHRVGLTHLSVAGAGGVYLPLGGRLGDGRNGLEGAYGSLSLAQPLYSSLASWSWSASGAFENHVARKYQNGELKQFEATNVDGTTTNVPFQWRSRMASAAVAATRSYGWARKNDFTLGFSGSLRHYSTEGVDGIDPRAVSLFVQSELPTGENRVYPYARWRSYSADFFRTIEVESLGVQEDFRLGHDVYLEIDSLSRALGSTRSLVSVLGGAMWTSRIGDGLVRASVEGAVDTQSDYHVSDAMLDAKLGIVSPRTGLGRLIFSGRAIHRPENYLKRTEFLGGDSRLRGYPSSLFYGSELVAMNLELRTPGYYNLGMAMNGVLFYDSGDAFSDRSKLSLKHSVGAGVRFLLPFFDDIVYRFDFAVPLNRGALPSNAGRFDFLIAVEQAYPFPNMCSNATNALQVTRHCP
jgi:hypothetical protein